MIKFENPTNGRYYYLCLGKDMLNELVLRVIYGSRSVRRTRIIASDSGNNISTEIYKLIKRRIKRGYILIK